MLDYFILTRFFRVRVSPLYIIFERFRKTLEERSDGHAHQKCLEEFLQESDIQQVGVALAEQLCCPPVVTFFRVETVGFALASFDVDPCRHRWFLYASNKAQQQVVIYTRSVLDA